MATVRPPSVLGLKPSPLFVPINFLDSSGQVLPLQLLGIQHPCPQATQLLGPLPGAQAASAPPALPPQHTSLGDHAPMRLPTYEPIPRAPVRMRS